MPELILLIIVIGFTYSFLQKFRKKATFQLAQPIPKPNYDKKHEYLQSTHYKLLRTQRLVQDSYQCQICKTEDQLEVHHITYERLYYEQLSDLVTLCRHCHQQIHEKYGYSYDRTYPIGKYDDSNIYQRTVNPNTFRPFTTSY